MMEFSRVILDRAAGGVVTLTLNRPDRRNALDEALGDEFAAAIETIDRDESARVLLLRGAGKAFCAGGDLGMLDARGEGDLAENRARMLAFYRRFLGLVSLEIPTIAAVHGAAIGAGMALALACDLRVVGRGARLAVNFVQLGLTPGMGSTYFLPRLAGPEVATDLLLTGRVITGEEASALGICGRLVPDDEVHHAAQALAAHIAAGPAEAVRLTRRRISRDLSGLSAALEEEAASQATCFNTEDFRERLQAARETR